MESVFAYTDYRKFLKDTFDEMKASAARTSYRAIAAQAGINAGNLVKILKGERNLTLASALKLYDVCKMCKKEKEYFQNMLLFCQAKNHVEKKRYFENMLSFKQSKARIVDADQYEFYDKWYYTAVRETLAFYPFNGENSAALGKLITPTVSEEEVTKAIDLLLSLGLIDKDEAGFYKRKDALLSSGTSARSVELNNYIIGSMALAQQAIGRGDGPMNLSSVAITMTEEDFKKVEEEIRSFRRTIMDLAARSQAPNRVWQVSIQAFPLTKEYVGPRP